MDDLHTNTEGWGSLLFVCAAFGAMYGLGNLMALMQTLEVDAVTIVADGFHQLLNHFL